MVKHRVEEVTLSAKTNTLESTFSKLALALYNIVVDQSEVNLNNTKTIILKSKSIEDLLYQFLKKFYDLTNNELFLLGAVKQVTIERILNEYLLTAVVVGDKMNEKYRLKDIVKQITNRGITIKEDRNGVSAQIIIVVDRRE